MKDNLFMFPELCRKRTDRLILTNLTRVSPVFAMKGCHAWAEDGSKWGILIHTGRKGVAKEEERGKKSEQEREINEVKRQKEIDWGKLRINGVGEEREMDWEHWGCKGWKRQIDKGKGNREIHLVAGICPLENKASRLPLVTVLTGRGVLCNKLNSCRF